MSSVTMYSTYQRITVDEDPRARHLIKARIENLMAIEERDECEGKLHVLDLIKAYEDMKNEEKRIEYLWMHNQSMPPYIARFPDWKYDIYKRMLTQASYVYWSLRESRTERDMLWRRLFADCRSSRFPGQCVILLKCKTQSQVHRDARSSDLHLCRKYMEDCQYVLENLSHSDNRNAINREDADDDSSSTSSSSTSSGSEDTMPQPRVSTQPSPAHIPSINHIDNGSDSSSESDCSESESDSESDDSASFDPQNPYGWDY